MSTRLYLPAAAESTPITPEFGSGWDDLDIAIRAMMTTYKRSLAMVNRNFNDTDWTDLNILYFQGISEELTTPQTIHSLQALKGQICVHEGTEDNNGNLFVAWRCVIFDSTGVYLRKTVLELTRDDVEAPGFESALQNRKFTATSAAINYEVQPGDRIVIECGMGGDPSGTATHDSQMRFGDTEADCPEDDTAYSGSPWFQLADTLSFVGEGQPTTRRFGAVQNATRIRGAESVRMF